MGLGKLANIYVVSKAKSISLIITKPTSRWIKDLNIKNRKNEKKGKIIEDIDIDKEFLNRISAAQEKAQWLNKCDHVKLEVQAQQRK